METTNKKSNNTEAQKSNVFIKDLGKDIYLLCNVHVFWAKLNEENMDRRFNEGGVFTLDVQLPIAEAQKLNKEYGLQFKHKVDQEGNIVDPNTLKMRFKKNRVIIVDGQEKILNPPDVVDKNLNKVECLIGNGSVCNISFKKRAYTYKTKKGVTFDLRGVQVIDLIPYEGGRSDFEVLDTDFSCEAPDESGDLPF